MQKVRENSMEKNREAKMFTYKIVKRDPDDLGRQFAITGLSDIEIIRFIHRDDAESYAKFVYDGGLKTF